jgi:hypothetical protein
MLMMVGGSRRVFGVFFSSTLRFDLGHYENFWWSDSFDRKLTAAEEQGDLGS